MPFIGHAKLLGTDPFSFLDTARREYGDHFRFRMVGRSMHALTSPAGHKAFFDAPKDQLSAREAYQMTVPMFGEGVMFGATPEIMEEQLRLIHPLLRGGMLESHTDSILREMEQIAHSMGATGVIDLRNLITELVMLIVARAFVGEDFRDMLTPHFARLYRDLEGGINPIAYLAPNFPTIANYKRNRARRAILRLLLPLIAQRRARKAMEDDFLSGVINSRYPDGSAPKDEEIVGMLLAMLLASRHTTSMTATWVGITLLQNPEEFAAIQSEAAEKIGGASITPAIIKSLTRMDCFVKEVERCYPICTMMIRKVLRDFEFGGFTAPAGASVMISPFVSHRLEKSFSEPHRFDPARFGPDREEDKRTPHSLIGFGGGKHRCLGISFAYYVIKVIWTLLPQHFDFELIDRNPVHLHNSMQSSLTAARVRYTRKY